MRAFTRFKITFAVLLVAGLFSFMSAAHADEYKSEVGVNAWCLHIAIPKKIIELSAAGKFEEANAMANAAMQVKACVAIPYPAKAAFKPKEEVFRYKRIWR